MITGLLGVPDEDAPQLFHWADQIVYNADPDYSPAVSDQTDTDPYRLLPFRSPVSAEGVRVRATPGRRTQAAPTPATC
jgi:cytochrome P450